MLLPTLSGVCQCGHVVEDHIYPLRWITLSSGVLGMPCGICECIQYADETEKEKE